MQKRQKVCRLLILCGVLLGSCYAQAQIAPVGVFTQGFDTSVLLTFQFTAAATATHDAVCIQVQINGAGSGTAPSSVTLTGTGWAWTQIGSIQTGNYGFSGSAALFCAIAPDTTSRTFTVTWVGATNVQNHSAIGDEFSGTDTTGGTTTFEAVGQNGASSFFGGTVGATVTPISSDDAIFAASCDSSTSPLDIGGQTPNAGAADGNFCAAENVVLVGNAGVAQAAEFTVGSNYLVMAVAIKPLPPPPVSALSLFWMQPNTSVVISALIGTHATLTTITQTGLASGDLVFVLYSDQTTSPLMVLSSTSGCSSTGNLLGGQDATNQSVQNVGLWCIANATSASFSITNCTSDCGGGTAPFHSTTGWNIASAASATSGTGIADANPVIATPALSISGGSCVIVGEFAEESVAETLSSSGSWVLGQNNGAHVDGIVYQMNLGSGSYSPAVGRNTVVSTAKWISISAGMCAN